VKLGIIPKTTVLKGASSSWLIAAVPLVLTAFSLNPFACLASSSSSGPSSSKAVRAHRTSRTVPAQKDNYLQLATRGHPHRWLDSDMPLRVWIKPGTGVPKFKPQHEQIVREAIQEWQDSSNSKISFRYVTGPPADITVQFVQRINPKSLIAGLTTYEDTPNRIFNVRVRLGTESDGWYGNDFRCTCLHELGHGLGLINHSLDPHDTMYMYNNVGQHHLSARDIKTIQMLYGANAPAVVVASKPLSSDVSKPQSPSSDASKPQSPDASKPQSSDVSKPQTHVSWKLKEPPPQMSAEQQELQSKNLEPDLSPELALDPLTKNELDLIATVPALPEAPLKIKLSPTEYILYNEKIIARLKRFFPRFPLRELLECEISCLVDNKGNIYNYKVIKESAIEQFDSTALTSLVMALPLPPIATKGQVPGRTPICLRFFSNGSVLPKLEPSSWDSEYLTACEKPTPALAMREVAKVTEPAFFSVPTKPEISEAKLESSETLKSEGSGTKLETGDAKSDTSETKPELSEKHQKLAIPYLKSSLKRPKASKQQKRKRSQRFLRKKIMIGTLL